MRAGPGRFFYGRHEVQPLNATWWNIAYARKTIDNVSRPIALGQAGRQSLHAITERSAAILVLSGPVNAWWRSSFDDFSR